MTKNDYIKLAKVINDSFRIRSIIDTEQSRDASYCTTAMLMYGMMDMLQKDNPKFNPDTFELACREGV